MPKHLSRPPFVLGCPADGAGCGFHRLIRPLQILGRNGYISGRAEQQFQNDAFLKAILPDVVVLQRQYEEGSLKHIRRYRETLPNAHFVFELDDILSAVPEDSEIR